jgi:hypothetical protein
VNPRRHAGGIVSVARRSLAGALGLFALACGALASQASASTIAVTSLSDSGAGSLRAAIAGASPGDSITIPAGQITLTSEPLTISKDLTITGAGVSASVISGNDASRILTIAGAPTVTLEGLTLTHGKDEFGGAIRAAGGSLTLRRVSVTGNRAGGTGTLGFGGGIDFGAGTLSVIESSITANSAGGGKGGSGFGGGIDYEGTAAAAAFSLSLTRSTVAGNTAGGAGSPGFGGGVDVAPGYELEKVSVSILESSLSDNTAGGGTKSSGYGGGIELSSGGEKSVLTMTIERSAVSGNTAGGGEESSGFGGGIEFGSGGIGVTQSLAAVNTTIAGNTAGGGGSSGYGGALLFSPGTASLSNMTIAGNSTGGEGGKAPNETLAVTPTTTVASSILIGNGENCGEHIISGGHNIEDDATCGLTAAGDRQNTAQPLGALAQNGGPTPTLVPALGSAAIDGGPSSGCPATDQRGLPRPYGAACDVGAVEVAPPAASTGAASSLTATGATVAGSAGDPSIAAGTISFQYGTSAAYGSQSPAQTLASGASGAPFAAALTGLTPNSTYHYRIVASTPDGVAYGADRTFATQLPPVPVITALSQSRRSWREGSRIATIARKAKPPVGTTFSFALSTAATVTLTFTQPAAGRLSAHRCVAPTRRNAHARHCTRLLSRGSLSFAGHVGANRVSFQGRLAGGHRLARGSYTLVVSATDAFRQRAAPRSVSFKITG